MSKINQINIMDKDDRERLELLENLKETTLLIDEEESFVVIPKANIVIREYSHYMMGIEYTEMTIDDYKEAIKEDIQMEEENETSRN